MDFLIYSDIHSNLHSLQVFMEYRNRLPGEVKQICLGDTVGYNAFPSECIEIVRKSGASVLAGNHERMILNPETMQFAVEAARLSSIWTAGQLSAEDKSWAASLPNELLIQPGLLAVHGSPLNPDEYLFHAAAVVNNIPELKKRNIQICLFGHTHCPGLFDETGGFYYEPDSRVRLEPDRCYFINPGSIGQPRDRDPRAGFCVLNTEELTVSFIRYPYDIEAAAKSIRQAGLPESSADRLFYGL